MRKILASLLILSASAAHAWQPNKPVTVIFPNGPGAGNEISFRIVADIVARQTGTNFVVNHRPGADGNIAMNHFATVPADGYTIAVPACQSNWVTADIWYPNIVKYNAQEFEPVANIARSPLAFWAHPSSNINTPEELVAAIRRGDRPMNFAIGGAGHKLAVEFLVQNVAKNSDTVQTATYQGPAQALNDVVGNHVEFGVTPVAVGVPLMQAGKLKLIGIANERPLKGLESAPLMNKWAPGLNIHGCWNLVLPKGTPPDVQKWYAEHFVPAIRSAEAATKFEQNLMYITPAEHNPAGMRASMERTRQVWQPIARRINNNK